MEQFNVANYGNALGQGFQIGRNVFDANRQTALADLYKTQGASILAGDPGALNALAAEDLMQALQVQNTLADNRRADAQFGMQREQHGLSMELNRERIAEIRRQAAEAVKAEAARMDAATLERERQQLSGVVSGARQAIIAGPDAWEAFKGTIPPDMWQQSGIDPASLTFESAPAALAMVVGMLEGVEEARQFSEGMGQQQPDYITINGQLVNRAAPGGPAVVNVPGLKPAGPDTVVNVGEGESAFTKETGKLLATEAAEVASQGAQAQRSLASIMQLEGLIETIPDGATGALSGMAANFGIKTAGASELEAAQAIINQLVPQQRAPGSGPMSDADLALFKQSLPRLINTRDGNRLIVRTMRAIAEYDVERGRIARAQQLGEISARDAARAYEALPNPLANITASLGQANGQPADPASQGGSWPTLENGRPDWANMTEQQMKSYFESK